MLQFLADDCAWPDKAQAPVSETVEGRLRLLLSFALVGLDVISGRFLLYGLEVLVVLVLYVDDAVTVLLLMLADARVRILASIAAAVSVSKTSSLFEVL